MVSSESLISSPSITDSSFYIVDQEAQDTIHKDISLQHMLLHTGTQYPAGLGLIVENQPALLTPFQPGQRFYNGNDSFLDLVSCNLKSHISGRPSVNDIDLDANIMSSAATSQWNADSSNQTPLLLSHDNFTSPSHQSFRYDTLPALFSSPGTTISTPCATPASINSLFDECRTAGQRAADVAHNGMSDIYYNDLFALHESVELDMQARRSESVNPQAVTLAGSSYNAIPASYAYSSPTMDGLTLPNFLPKILASQADIGPLDQEAHKHRVMEERTKPKRKRAESNISLEDKPECPNCHKVFSRKHNLTQHQAVSCEFSATKTKDFDCNSCGASFHRQTDLSRHMTSKHSDTKPFECILCKQKFPRQDTLRRHFNKSCKMNQAVIKGSKKQRRKLLARVD